MGTIKQRITNCLWFDSQAEDAAKFYTSIFKNSSIGAISRYGQEGFDFHKQAPGTAMVVNFQLDGQDFMALNGGPVFKFNEAISLVINCESQEEIDYYWEKLTDGGEEGNCGWLKDKYGLSWQVAPAELGEMMTHPDQERTQRVTRAFLQMKKFDLEKLRQEFEGSLVENR